MTTYNEVFDEKQYRSVNLSAAQKYLDLNISSALPRIPTDIFDAYEYLLPKIDEATGAVAGVDYVEDDTPMSAMHEHEIVELFVHQGIIKVRNQDIWKYGDALLADKHEAKIDHLVKTIDDAAFHGPISKLGLQIAQGIIGQLTPLIDITSLGGHDASGKGEIWEVLRAMILDIPLAMRQTGPPMILYINEITISEAKSPERIYQDKIEWDFIYDQFIGPMAPQGQKIGEVIITNKINANVEDAHSALHAAANGYQTADTLGTTGRMLLVVPDTRWGGVIESAGFHKVYEYQKAMSVDMMFGWHGKAEVIDGDAWNYTEALTF